MAYLLFLLVVVGELASRMLSFCGINLHVTYSQSDEPSSLELICTTTNLALRFSFSFGQAFIKNYVQTETELAKPNEFSSNCQMAEAVRHVKMAVTGLTHDL